MRFVGALLLVGLVGCGSTRSGNAPSVPADVIVGNVWDVRHGVLPIEFPPELPLGTCESITATSEIRDDMTAVYRDEHGIVTTVRIWLAPTLFSEAASDVFRRFDGTPAETLQTFTLYGNELPTHAVEGLGWTTTRADGRRHVRLFKLERAVASDRPAVLMLDVNVPADAPTDWGEKVQPSLEEITGTMPSRGDEFWRGQPRLPRYPEFEVDDAHGGLEHVRF